MGRVSPAIDALLIALSINPNFPEAHARLAHIYRKLLGDDNKATEHRKLAREMRLARRRIAATKGTYGVRRQTDGRPTADVKDRANEHRPPCPAPSDNVDRAAAEESVIKHERLENRPVDLASRTLRASHVPTNREMDDRAGGDNANRRGQPITVVSGLPRSGTSMVMQMLAAGGLEILTDGRRTADAHNPRGYLEFEPVKNLQRDNRWLREAQGKAVKIVAPLLTCLAAEYRYRVIYMERDLDEVIASQRTMLEGEGLPAARVSHESLKRVFDSQSRRLKQWLAQQPQIDALTLSHRETIADASGSATRIEDFLGVQLDREAMSRVVTGALYRSRTPGETGPANPTPQRVSSCN